MEAFKKEHFERDNPGRAFPEYRALDVAECKKIRERLARRLELDPAAAPKEVLNALTVWSEPWEESSAGEENFDLRALVETLDLKPGNRVFVNWRHFDEIDVLDYSDLCAFFGDIWYPGSDDLEIFDASLNWMLGIDHHGSISILRWDDQVP